MIPPPSPIRPSPIRPVAVILAITIVLSGCSGADSGLPGSSDPDVGELGGPLPGQPDTSQHHSEAATEATGRDRSSDESALDAAVAAPRSSADHVPATPRGDEALTQPLPPEPPPDIPQVEPPVAPFTNPWEDTGTDARSTFGLDVDTVSYGRIREAVTTGRPVTPSEVRVEEVVNALDYDYPTTGAEVFAVATDGAAWRWGESGTHLLRIGLATPPAEARDPVDLVFVIDASGSMATAMPIVKDSLGVLVEQLEPGADRIAIVAYNSTAETILPPTDVADRDGVLDAISRVSADGSTNLAAGLARGYDEAARMTEDAAAAVNTRVILLSDGIANTGVTDVEGILDMVSGGVDAGIELLTVGFGMGGFNDPLMEQLADRGDGRAVYVDTPDEARELFGTQLAATLQTVAVEARSQVEFNPEVVAAYRLLGYDNRAIADDDFRDDTVDAGEVGAGHTVTALYEVDFHDPDARPAGDREVARVSLRWLDPDTHDAHEFATTVTMADIASSWESASAGLRLAGTAAAWAEVLRTSPYATSSGLDDLAIEAHRIADAVGTDQLHEWASLVGRTADA